MSVKNDLQEYRDDQLGLIRRDIKWHLAQQCYYNALTGALANRTPCQQCNNQPTNQQYRRQYYNSQMIREWSPMWQQVLELFATKEQVLLVHSVHSSRTLISLGSIVLPGSLGTSFTRLANFTGLNSSTIPGLQLVSFTRFTCLNRSKGKSSCSPGAGNSRLGGHRKTQWDHGRPIPLSRPC